MSALLALMSVLSISSGELVGECGWPSALDMWSGASNCSAVLVHPRVALIPGAGCYEYFPGDLRFGYGDAVYMTFVQADPSACEFQGGVGFCVLPEAIDVPIAPILAGCELAQLQAGTPVELVGFGADAVGNLNEHKRHGPAEVDAVVAPQFWVVGEHAPCQGDAGSPAFVQMSDGSWRAAGISTLGGDCTNPSSYMLLAPLVEWIEAESGFDVSPCHDADGLPDLGPDCAGFFSGGAGGEGTWADLCATAPVGGDGGVCSGDTRSPSVVIVTPDEGTRFDAGPVALDLVVLADDGTGLGVHDVRLSIQGEVQAYQDTEPPYEFALDVPDGEWTIVAAARDWGGNVAVSESLVLQVGAIPAGTDDTGSGDTGSTSDASTTGDAMPTDETTGFPPPAPGGDDDTGTDDAPAEDSGGGCACDVSGRARSGAPWLFALAVVLRRRRSWRAA